MPQRCLCAYHRHTVDRCVCGQGCSFVCGGHTTSPSTSIQPVTGHSRTLRSVRHRNSTGAHAYVSCRLLHNSLANTCHPHYTVVGVHGLRHGWHSHLPRCKERRRLPIGLSAVCSLPTEHAGAYRCRSLHLPATNTP